MYRSRLLASLLGALVLVVSFGPTVDAQFGRGLLDPPRPYVGPLFWEELQSSTPGARWIRPPRRAHRLGGDGFTSFPDRVWSLPLVGAPPNDSCHARGERLTTNPYAGPYGIQVVQYIGDWWRGLVYRPHVTDLGPLTEMFFGYFDFAPRAGRSAVSSGGVPRAFAGGACVARALALLHGSVEEGSWSSATKDIPTGRDCLATSHFVVLRLNTELRCEPDLSDPDDEAFTRAFWDFFDSRTSPTGPVIFPSDYEAGTEWLRRVEVGFFGLDGGSEGSGGSFAVSGFDSPAYPTGGAPLPSYREFHPDAFGLSAEADLRNPLQATDLSGAPTGEPMRLFDGRAGVEDCLEWNTARPGERFEHDWRCDRENSAMASNENLEDGARRALEAGPATPMDMTEAEATLPLAHPRMHPFPPPAGAVWTEWNRSMLRCRWNHALLAPLPEQARDRRDFWRGVFVLSVSQVPTAVPSPIRHLFEAYMRDDPDPAVTDMVTWAHGHWQGWEALLAYREATQAAAIAGLENAGYAVQVGSELYLGDEDTGCVSDFMPSLQVGPAAPGQTTGALWQRFKAFGVPSETPEYWATDGRIMHMRGTVSPRNLASAVGGRLPGGSAVADIMSGPTAYREFSCGTAVEHLFAPDISVFTPDLGGVFEPDAVLADDRGTYQRYEKDNLSSFVSALRGTYGRTTSPDYSGGFGFW